MWEIFVVLRQITLAGCALAMMALGAVAGPFEEGLAAYEQGDSETAHDLWLPLAKQGDAAAQHNLGVMYSMGQSVAQDYREAIRWWRLAAEQGFSDAQYSLGVMYEFGHGVQKNEPAAATWFRAAAEQGRSAAQYRLGLMYFRGAGVPQDFVIAHMWLNLAAAQDNNDAAHERDALAAKMTVEQLAKARQFVRVWERERSTGSKSAWPQEEVVLQRLKPIWQEKPAVARALLRRSPISGASSAVTHKRLKIVNGCSSEPIWVNFLVGSGGGTLVAHNQHKLADENDYIEYDIPDKGLASTRFWPSMGCDSTGNNCQIGQSGGPAEEGFACPAPIGCAPPIDSLFENTFGCLPSLSESECQTNPSDPSSVLGRSDNWDFSMVDGYTLPFKVEVDPSSTGKTCDTNSPNIIDCSNLKFSLCPTNEQLGPLNGSKNLALKYPKSDGTPSATQVGCYAPCSKLTMGQWQSIPNPPFSGTTYKPSDPQAQYYCCPTPPITSDQCRAGPVAETDYVKLIHSKCTNGYAYSYDDGAGLKSCPAGTVYTVTFYCPKQQ